MAKEIKYYPLVAAQDMLFFSQKFSLKKSIVDICSMMNFDCEIDPGLLMQAAYLAMMRNKSASIRLHKVGKETMQYFSDEAPDKIMVMDYSDRTQEELDADLNKWSQTPFPNGSMDTQLYALRLILKPDGFYGLYFCVSHLAFDAFALMATVSDMMEIYVALRDGKPITPYKGDYLRLCETDWEYQKSEKKQQDLAWWDAYYDTEPLFTPVEPSKMKRYKDTRTGKAVDIINSSAYHVNLPVDAELVSRVNALAMGLGISPQCCFLLGIRSFLSAINGDQDDIQINNTVARRANLLQKRSGGTLVMGIPFRMHMDNSTTVTDALKEVSNLQKKFYAHANVRVTDVMVDIFEKKFNKKPMNGYNTVNVTYNPFMAKLPEGIKAHTTTYCNGASAQPLYLSIMALDDSGALNCNYECMKSFTTSETAYKFHAHLVKALDAMTKNPSMTLLELNRV